MASSCSVTCKGPCSGGKGAILTDPVILSSTGSYGVTDLGCKGISTFFARHRCSRFCMDHWKTIKGANAYYEAFEGTTMELTQPERAPRILHQPNICKSGKIDQIAEDSESYPRPRTSFGRIFTMRILRMTPTSHAALWVATHSFGRLG